jgi:hypothetical protein
MTKSRDIICQYDPTEDIIVEKESRQSMKRRKTNDLSMYYAEGEQNNNICIGVFSLNPSTASCLLFFTIRK